MRQSSFFTIILEVSLVLNYFLGGMKIEKVLVKLQFCYLTRKTETFDSSRIEFATLPRTFPLKPPRPFVPITTRSTFPFSANLAIADAGFP